jgi:hypothetical protein
LRSSVINSRVSFCSPLTTNPGLLLPAVLEALAATERKHFVTPACQNVRSVLQLRQPF